MSRPILIDEATDGPCEACTHWAASYPVRSCDGRYFCQCFRCGNVVGCYLNMWGFRFQSPKPHHYHLEPIPVEGGQPIVGRVCKFEELCWDCYLEAFAEAYPGEKSPKPPVLIAEPLTPDQLALKEQLERPPVGEVIAA